MSDYSRNDDDTISVHTGITIFTDNLISYEYFQEYFSNTIDYFKTATITYTYKDDLQTATLVLNYYNKFVTEVLKINAKITLINGSVTIPLMVFLMANYKAQLDKSIDILRPIRYYDFETDKDYFKTYDDNLKIVSEMNFVSLGVDIKEEFVFQDKSIPKRLKELSKISYGVDQLEDILTIIGYAKMSPDDPQAQQSNFDIDFSKIALNKSMDYSNIWAYLLFNLYFLEKRYVIVLTSDLIDVEFGFATGAVMFDMEKLTEFLEAGKSGTIINTSIVLETIDFIEDQDSFKALKKEIQEAYDELYTNKKSLQDHLQKATKHIERQVELFTKSKSEFHIVMKNGKVDTVKDIISSANPKRRTEIEQKLGGVDGYYHDEQGKTRTYQKKRKIARL